MFAVATKDIFGPHFGKCFNQSKAGQPPQPIIPLFRAVVTDGEVVIHLINGHLVLTTRLLSLGCIWALLTAFYTMGYIDNAKGWLYF